MDLGHLVQIAGTLAQDSKQGGNILGLLLPLVLLGAVAYFLLIRPQQKRAQQHQRLVSELEPGDEVITIGGMFGEIVEIDDERATLEMYDGTQIEFLRTAISRKVAPDRSDEMSQEDVAEEPEDDEAAEPAKNENGKSDSAKNAKSEGKGGGKDAPDKKPDA